MNRHHRDAAQRTDLAARGASMVEYGLMISLIMLAALAGVSALSGGAGGSADDSASRVVAAD